MLFRAVMLVSLSGTASMALFNIRRLRAKFKMPTDVLDELLCADDLTERAKTETKMQGAMDRMSQACDKYNLTISTKPTEVVLQSAPGKLYSEPTITVNGTNCKLSINLPISQQFTLMIRLLSELRKPVWHLADLAQMSGSGMETKLNVYKVVVLPTM